MACRALTAACDLMSSRRQGCARGRNDNYDTAPENVTVVVSGALLAAAKSKGLHLWFSDLAEGNDSDQLFVNKGQLTVGADGSFKLPLGLNQMYTVTTIGTGSKGNHSVPAAGDVPLPYTQNFDSENTSSPARLWYDQMGAWEIHPARNGTGNVMRQM